MTDMLESDEFVRLIKTLRPWGEDEQIMIPYTYLSEDSSTVENGFITIKFDESL